MAAISYRTADVDGLKIFYREAGPPGRAEAAAAARLPERQPHVPRPDPAAGRPLPHRRARPARASASRTCRPRDEFAYTFDNIAGVIDRFTEVVGLDRFAIYVFDYGAPTGFRARDASIPSGSPRSSPRTATPMRKGLSEGWNPIRAYWQDPSPANREALRAFLDARRRRSGNTRTACPTRRAVSPDGYSLDNFYLARPGADEIQLDLFGDYESNVALYPAFQDYFRTHRPPLPGGLGQERSVLPAARRRGVQARHSGRRRPLLRHRPFRAGNARRRDRGGDPRLPRTLDGACRQPSEGHD